MTRSIRTHQLFFHLVYCALLPSPFIFSFQERKPETLCLSFASVASRKILLTGFTAPSSFAEVLLLLVVFFSSAGQFTFPKMMMNWQSRIWICYLNQYKLWNMTYVPGALYSIRHRRDPFHFRDIWGELCCWSRCGRWPNKMQFWVWRKIYHRPTKQMIYQEAILMSAIKRYNWPFHSLGNDVSSYWSWTAWSKTATLES